jgi:hypothetical protein
MSETGDVLVDREGDEWIVRRVKGVTFLEDPDGERFTLDFVGRKFGPLTARDASHQERDKRAPRSFSEEILRLGAPSGGEATPAEPWQRDEASFERHFGVSYADFCRLGQAMPEKMEKYERTRATNEEAAILWLVHEGVRHGHLQGRS